MEMSFFTFLARKKKRRREVKRTRAEVMPIAISRNSGFMLIGNIKPHFLIVFFSSLQALFCLTL